MAFTDDQKTRILAAVNQQLAKNTTGAKCAVCNQFTWTIEGSGLVYLVLQPDPKSGLALSGPALPNVALRCTTCGNTHLLNVFTLGIADLFGLLDALPDTPTGSAPEVAAPVAGETK